MSTTESENNSPISEYEWMIRPCEMYKEEYSDCTSIKARFHQYFIYGETLDCKQWNRDYANCTKYQDSKDLKAATELLESEKSRRRARLGAHYGNNTWERRSQPPEDWNKPLPEWISKEYENTYLDIKSKEMRGELPKDSSTEERTLCAIM